MDKAQRFYRLYNLEEDMEIRIALFCTMLNYTNPECNVGPQNNKSFQYTKFSKQYTESNTNERNIMNAVFQKMFKIRNICLHGINENIDYEIEYFDVDGKEQKDNVDLIQYCESIIIILKDKGKL